MRKAPRSGGSAKAPTQSRIVQETPEQLARMKKRARSRMIWAGIIIVIGAAALGGSWDIGSMLFEKEGPVPLDLAQFEAKDDIPLKDLLAAMPAGYSRNVALGNAKIYNFEYLQSSNTKEYFYELVSGDHPFVKKAAEVKVSIDTKQVPLQKVQTTPPSPERCRVLLRCLYDTPIKKREAVEFFTGIEELQSDAKYIVGVMRPYSNIETAIRSEISSKRCFSNLRIDEPNKVYVLTLGQKPPDSMMAVLCFVGPLLVMAIGVVLLVTKPRK